MARVHRTRRQCHLTETETTNKCPKQKVITVDKGIKVNEKPRGKDYEFQASLGCIVKSCLKTKPNKTAVSNKQKVASYKVC